MLNLPIKIAYFVNKISERSILEIESTYLVYDNEWRNQINYDCKGGIVDGIVNKKETNIRSG